MTPFYGCFFSLWKICCGQNGKTADENECDDGFHNGCAIGVSPLAGLCRRRPAVGRVVPSASRRWPGRAVGVPPLAGWCHWRPAVGWVVPSASRRWPGCAIGVPPLAVEVVTVEKHIKKSHQFYFIT